MRKYRGLTKEGKWVYGCLLISADGRTAIVHPPKIFDCAWKKLPMLNVIEVIPETVGQSTGLFDKNGQEIYKGDIVKVLKKELIGHFHGKKNCNVFIRRVDWHSSCAEFVCRCAGGHAYRLLEDWPIEVIGDIHTKPDLLEQDNG